MLPLTGYTDTFSAPPGGKIEFKVSSTYEAPFSADLVRIIHGDPNPDGPGLKFESLPASFSGEYPSRQQDVVLGSYAITKPFSSKDGEMEAFTIGATIWPTLPNKDQAILSRFDKNGRGFCLGIGPSGTFITLKESQNEFRLCVDKELRQRVWYRVVAKVNVREGRVSISQVPLVTEFGVDDLGEVTRRARVSNDVAGHGGSFVVAAQCLTKESFECHFNGKIERPFVVGRCLNNGEVQRVVEGDIVDKTVALWDFSHDIESEHVRDCSHHGLHARLINLPTRAMKGSRWSGDEMCWRHAPNEYGAIHFHEDDIYDSGWETDFCFQIPEDMPSGVYGAKLVCEDAEEILPFYVRPKTGMPTSHAVFLASTFTYQIYANHVRGNSDEAYFDRARSWGARMWHPDQHRDYGASTYNRHSDGSGICYSSRLRPILTMRPGFLTFNDPRGSGLRHFPADTHLLDWLEAMGQDFDVVTDEDLDKEGYDLLKPYRVVLTGSHPEYHTKNTLDSLQTYVDNGGRMMYLGGNGFYWRIASSSHLPGVLEIRRGEGGIRAWAAEPGEYYHSLDGGTYGGLWRRNCRTPNRLAGVGFSSQGMFEGSYYVRTEASQDPRVSWIFEGVEGTKLGDFGLSGGGAAGFELDRVDYQLGTPRNTVVLASSRGHSDTFIPVHEEMLTHVSTTSGSSPEEMIHADMVFFESPNGGAVFSTGSITFCGSLSYNDYENNISQILSNVLTRFRSDEYGQGKAVVKS